MLKIPLVLIAETYTKTAVDPRGFVLKKTNFVK